MFALEELYRSISMQFKKAKGGVSYVFYSESIDTLRFGSVNWNPYTSDKLQQRAPGGLSSLCTRDQKFWLTKRNLIYDVFVEEYAPRRFMRQFNLEKRIPPPLENPVPQEIHTSASVHPPCQTQTQLKHNNGQDCSVPLRN